MHRPAGPHNENVGMSPRGASKEMSNRKEALVQGARMLAVAAVSAVSSVDLALATPFARLAAVPEPGSLTIFALALLGIWAIKRRADGRNKK